MEFINKIYPLDKEFFVKNIHLGDLQKIIEVETEKLQHLLECSDKEKITVLRNEQARLISEIIRLMQHKATLNKEINDLTKVIIAGEEMSIKDPKDIVKNILDKNIKQQNMESTVFSEIEESNFRQEALRLAYEAALKEGLFNLKWPTMTETLPPNATREEKFQHQLTILSSQLQTLFTIANYNYNWIISGKLQDKYL